MNNNSKREINFFSRWRVSRYPKATFTPLELGKYADFTKPVFCPFRNHWRNFWIVVRVFRAQLGLICVQHNQVWPYLSVDDRAMRVSRSDGRLRCDFSTNKLTISMSNMSLYTRNITHHLDRRNLRLSIISNPLWGLSNHKRYPQILCGLSSNHVRYPQILCGPCSCDSRFFLVIPYIFSITRGFL